MDAIIWTTGMRATGLGAVIPGERDSFGRPHVGECMRVQGVDDVFAADDAAWLLIDGGHTSVMSCQHARPMGRFAGHNVVCYLLEHEMPFQIGWYVTVLDLGHWDAVYTHAWDHKGGIDRTAGQVDEADDQLCSHLSTGKPQS